MRSQLSLEKKKIWSKTRFYAKNWKSKKNWIFWKKSEFFTKFQNPPKKMKKSRFFFKKMENLFSIKITSIGRKILLKLYLKSYESTVSAFEASNAPKSFLHVLARLKLQSLLFSAKNSRIFDFQILKMARLKAVNIT